MLADQKRRRHEQQELSMASLSELIYSQTSVASAPPESKKSKTPRQTSLRRKRHRGSSANGSPPSQSTNKIDDFYQLTQQEQQQESTAAPANADADASTESKKAKTPRQTSLRRKGQRSSSAANSNDNNDPESTASLANKKKEEGLIYGRHTARKQRLKYKKKKDVLTGNEKDEEEYEWETDSHYQQRLDGMKRSMDHAKTVRRWKRRKVDAENEIDHGDSIKTMIRMCLEQESRRRERKATRQSKKQRAQDGSSSHYSDSSSEEEEDEAQDKKKPPSQSSAATGHRPESWARGYQAPLPEELVLDYFKFTRLKLKRASIPATDEPRLRLINRESFLVNLWDPNKLFPQQFAYWNDQEAMFFHHKTLRKLASRHLLMSSNLGPSQEDRLLANLFQSPFPVDREASFLKHAANMGEFWKMFYTHVWKDRKAVAKVLGFHKQNDMFGPDGMIGGSMQPGASSARRNQTRGRLTRTWSKQQIDFLPPSDDHKDDMTAKEIAFANVPGSQPPQEEGRGQSQATEVSNDGEEEEGTLSPEESSEEGEMRVQPAPWTSYVYTKASVPPAPQFPLDESRVVFGGADRFIHVMRVVKIEQSMVALVLNTLLGRLGKARLEYDDEAIVRQHEAILSFLRELRVVHSPVPPGFSPEGIDCRHAPLLAYHHAVMRYCNYIANSGATRSGVQRLELKQETDLGYESEGGSDNSQPSSPQQSQASIKDVADALTEVCDQAVLHPGLYRVPHIHASVALARIAQVLTVETAEMIARPQDEMETPVHTIRQILELLELDEKLVESDGTIDQTVVAAGFLEHVLHRAAETFERCVVMDPNELEFRGWLLALRAGGLLLASGNLIGAGAHLYPSEKGGNSKQFASHEVRPKLKSFDSMLKSVASTWHDFLVYAKSHESSSCCSRLLTPMLEWNQVLALLVGASRKATSKVSVPTICRHIRRQHKDHLLAACVDDPSETARASLQQLFLQEEIDRREKIQTLAFALENQPGDVCHWRRLVRALGPVGKRIPKNKRTCQKTCTRCLRLRRGFRMDHDLSESLGKDRLQWWYPYLLGPTNRSAELPPGNKKLHRIFGEMEKCLHEALEKEEPIPLDEPESDGEADKEPVDESTMEEEWAWLRNVAGPPGPGPENVASDYKIAPTAPLVAKRKKTLDGLLPFGKEVDDEDLELDKECLVAGVSDEAMEVDTYRVVVACHLYGTSHASILDLVSRFLATCWETRSNTERFNMNCPAWTCLVWLASKQGLGIPRILMDLYQERVKSKQRNKQSQHAP